MIYEEVGSLAGIDYDYMISVALDNVAHAAGTSPDMVPILDIMDIEVSDLPAQTIIYAGKVNNLGVVYANTFVIRENDVTQILTWEITRDYTEKHSNMHADFLANTRYEKEATDAH
ncbi:hypothetical protein Ga0080574_TMP4340 [Salipiger abyssi]|uniref:Uncharacterized protein n=2 Tax=Salipiger abyssi TaxID=1250539 RepID=A0A1P8UZ48_9RHOB|nr:hypothetical protein Ga0080574_TMP4340 [Salipiger abyssi]